MTGDYRLIGNLGGGSPFAKIAALLAEPPAEKAHQTGNGKAKLPKLLPTLPYVTTDNDDISAKNSFYIRILADDWRLLAID